MLIPSLHEHLGYFHFRGYKNNTAILLFTLVYTFLCEHTFFLRGGIYLGVTIISSYHASIFSFLINCQSVFHSGCIILHSYQQCMRVPILHPENTIFFTLSTQVDMQYLVTVLIYISLMANDVHTFLTLQEKGGLI